VRAPRGFSLLELLVVVSIMGLLAVAGAPSLISWIGNTRVRASAESMANGLRLAQAEAVRRNASVIFTLVADPATLTASTSGVNWVLSVDGTASTVIQRKGSEGATRVAQGPVTPIPTGFAGSIQFNGVGQALTVTGTPPYQPLSAPLKLAFTAPNGDHPLQVWLSASGRVRLCDPARSAGDPQACEGT